MATETLKLFGVGTFLPTSTPVKELIEKVGGDSSLHEGWTHVGVAGPEDHPTTMGLQALKQALEQAQIPASELKLVLACGVSRDYPPSWSVSMEIVRLLELPYTTYAFDLTVGCLGSLTGLEVATGWLAAHGGGYAAIVNAERWNYTVDYADPAGHALWGHADGASAAVVGLGESTNGSQALATYRGACFANEASFNGLVKIAYGGTRQPVAPEGVSPFTRHILDKPAREIFHTYIQGYERVFEAAQERFGEAADALACNQISPNFTNAIGEVLGLEREQVSISGHETGHVGSADILIGIRRLFEAGKLKGRVWMAGSTPYAFGAGLFEC